MLPFFKMEPMKGLNLDIGAVEMSLPPLMCLLGSLPDAAGSG